MHREEPMHIKSFFIALLSTMVLSSGCIDLGRKTEWRQNLELHPWFDGPGSVDARLYEYKEEKYEVVSGQGISVGVFPGFMDWWQESGKYSGWGDKCATVLGYSLGSSLLNALFAMPTIVSIGACFEDSPDDIKEGSAFGVLGCHRWYRSSSTTLIKQGDKELVLKCTDDPYHFEILTPPSKFADGSILHFDYPGYKTILSQLENHDKVYVMISEENNAYDYRCFKKSKHVDGALIFEDMLCGEDENADRQVRFQREARKLKGFVEELSFKEGNCAFFLDEIVELKKSISDEIRIGDPSRDGVLVNIKKRREDIANRMSRAVEIEAIAAKARDILCPADKNEIFTLSLARRSDFAVKANTLIKRIDEYKTDVMRGKTETNDAAFLKEIDDLKSELSSIMDETREMERRRKLYEQERERRRKLCEQESLKLLARMDELPKRSFYEFAVNDAFRGRYAALRKRVLDFSENPSSERYSSVDGLKTEVKDLEDSFDKFLNDARAKIDAAKKEIENKKMAVSAISAEKARLQKEVSESCAKIRNEFEIANGSLQEEFEKNEEKIRIQVSRERTLQRDLEWARKHTKAALTARAALDENSLFAKVSAKAEGIEKIFDQAWSSFYDEGVRLTMYKARMDCRRDGTPNVVVGDGDSSIVISVRVERNSDVHDEWKRNIATLFDALKLSKSLSPFEQGFSHKVAGSYYNLGENEHSAFKRWQRYPNSQYKADLFVELRCLSGDGGVLLSKRVAFEPESGYDRSSWGDEEVRVAFEDVSQGVFDLVEKVDAVVLDGAAVCKLVESDLAKIRKLLSSYRAEKAVIIAKRAAQREENDKRIKAERAKGDIKIREVQARLDVAVKALREAQSRYNYIESNVDGVQDDDETEDPQDESQEYFSGEGADEIWINHSSRYRRIHSGMED
jgi:predicted  nucleic acid-binding Zn-ribbon protein